jgi:hypothetical protein
VPPSRWWKRNASGDLRRQIEELRGQLSRYAEALEEDLSSGREKVAVRTREGLKFEKSFVDAFTLLTGHLKGRPECRDLMNELNAGNGEGGESGNAGEEAGEAKPTPGRADGI